MERFGKLVRTLRRAYALTSVAILGLLGAMVATHSYDSHAQNFHRAEQARTGDQLSLLSATLHLARRAVWEREDNLLYRAALKLSAQKLADTRACRRLRSGWDVDVATAVRGFYLDGPGASLCERFTVFLTDAFVVASEGPGRNAAFERMYDGITPIRERILAVRSTYGALAARTESNLLKLHVAGVVTLGVLLAIQLHFVFGRGLAALVDQHVRLEDSATVQRDANERLEHAGRAAAEALVASDRARDEAERARRSEAAAHAMKSEFLARLSHEVRTPLNAIMGVAGLMRAETRTAADDERLALIQRSGGALDAMFDDLIELSRLGAGEVRIEAAPFAPRALAEAQVAAAAPLAAEKGMTIALSAAPEVEGRFIGDAGRLARILRALIDNAVKHAHGGRVSVTLSRWGEAGLRIEVADEGPGVPAERRETLFAAFEQGDGSATREAGGLGVGLALAARSARAMGGAIGVTDAPGGGARFWVEAPALPLPAMRSAAVA